MIYKNQNITINQGTDRLLLEFGEIKLEMGHKQAAQVANQILERCQDATQCCGTCSMWSGSRNSVMGRCTASLPEWVTRENDCVHKTDGTSCAMYRACN